jgi:hypothetical protein
MTNLNTAIAAAAARGITLSVHAGMGDAALAKASRAPISKADQGRADAANLGLPKRAQREIAAAKASQAPQLAWTIKIEGGDTINLSAPAGKSAMDFVTEHVAPVVAEAMGLASVKVKSVGSGKVGHGFELKAGRRVIIGSVKPVAAEPAPKAAPVKAAKVVAAKVVDLAKAVDEDKAAIQARQLAAIADIAERNKLANAKRAEIHSGAALRMPKGKPAEAKPARTIEAVIGGKPVKVRASYAEALAKAEAGILPDAPDFSAETHARFRKKLATLVELAGKGDAKGLAAIVINPISTSPKAMLKYQTLALVALKAKASQARKAARATKAS